ncbi:hypothetical protein [Methylobacterium isbiliense]|uniref:Uncharacterized protein n=1 Tax=Methylobacterium isbiliense TaxID=315478 RepID=A0ABQ4S9L6_9HYPH|nr:hypothetical protein [Methylobacterium isbiliense]MDN3622713.1 hypothetical protein [Methylobacterium isbiliense]GJD99890.1 hypothetical protein GMJLKIPL_1808 [Methylobacterium isbiliense]
MTKGPFADTSRLTIHALPADVARMVAETVKQMERERDEARAEVERLRPLGEAALAVAAAEEAERAATQAYHDAWDNQARRGIAPRDMDLSTPREAGDVAHAKRVKANRLIFDAAREYARSALTTPPPDPAA